jgi:prophage regulatory protein
MNFNPATSAANPPAAAPFEPITGKRRARPASIIIRPRDLMALLSVSRHGLARMVADEGLPAPIQLGPRSLGFVKAEVDKWLADRMAARDAA